MAHIGGMVNRYFGQIWFWYFISFYENDSFFRLRSWEIQNNFPCHMSWQPPVRLSARLPIQLLCPIYHQKEARKKSSNWSNLWFMWHFIKFLKQNLKAHRGTEIGNYNHFLLNILQMGTEKYGILIDIHLKSWKAEASLARRGWVKKMDETITSGYNILSSL